MSAKVSQNNDILQLACKQNGQPTPLILDNKINSLSSFNMYVFTRQIYRLPLRFMVLKSPHLTQRHILVLQ